MPDDNDVRQLYPHLCRALGLDDRFDQTDSSVQKSTVALLTEINHLLSTEYELVVRGYGNKNINYVRVPQTFSDDSFRNKVHLMMKHVEWQMKHIRGGLGDKMEDRVERMHQDGMRERRRFCTVKNPVIRAKAREKVHVRDTNADVIAFTNATNAGNKRNFSEMKVDNISVIRKRQRDVGRDNAITYFKQMKGRELTWLSKVFDDAKEDCKGDDLAKGPT
jgi:hypothetical protein